MKCSNYYASFSIVKGITECPFLNFLKQKAYFSWLNNFIWKSICVFKHVRDLQLFSSAFRLEEFPYLPLNCRNTVVHLKRFEKISYTVWRVSLIPKNKLKISRTFEIFEHFNKKESLDFWVSDTCGALGILRYPRCEYRDLRLAPSIWAADLQNPEKTSGFSPISPFFE